MRPARTLAAVTGAALIGHAAAGYCRAAARWACAPRRADDTQPSCGVIGCPIEYRHVHIDVDLGQADLDQTKIAFYIPVDHDDLDESERIKKEQDQL